jgi:hypothetical protein
MSSTCSVGGASSVSTSSTSSLDAVACCLARFFFLALAWGSDSESSDWNVSESLLSGLLSLASLLWHFRVWDGYGTPPFMPAMALGLVALGK